MKGRRLILEEIGEEERSEENKKTSVRERENQQTHACEREREREIREIKERENA